MAVRCPNCNERLRLPMIVQNTPVRCRSCDTRVIVAPGWWRKKVVDWETPNERQGERH